MKFSELKKGMLLSRVWPRKPIVDLIYIRRKTIDSVAITEFKTHHEYLVITAEVSRHRWDNEWTASRLATYEDAKIFIKNMFEPI